MSLPYTFADLFGWLRRLPIRWRLTLAFAAVMAILLAALIAFLYFHFRSDLDYNIDQSLRARAQEVAGLTRDENPADTRGALGTLPTNGDNFVQVLDPGGRVLGASAGFAQPALVSVAEIGAAAHGPRLIRRGDRSRLYALPLGDDRGVVVAGVSLSERDAALDKLDDALFIGVPPALLLASLAAYALAAAALRPVDQMRRRAATISAEEIDTRLPLPDSHDEIFWLGSTLNEMLDRLQDGLIRERLFVADASHELRMPLAVLKAELEVSLREQGGERALRAAITSAIEETDRITRLAEDLLLLARAQDGTLPIDPQPLPVEELFAELEARLTPAIEHAGRSWSVDIESIPPGAVVAADPERIHQALANLLDNSLHYGAEPITLSARQRAMSIEIHLSDRGPGFDPEFLPRAFDRFTREDPARSRGGVGLGLAIVRTIAQAHGGDAQASNLTAGGADVWIALPALPNPSPLTPESLTR
jgi:two-component system OmpR family sensor kinase